MDGARHPAPSDRDRANVPCRGSNRGARSFGSAPVATTESGAIEMTGTLAAPAPIGLTSEQHEIRSRGVGGSEAAAAVGLSSWKSAAQLWAEKTGKARRDDSQSEYAYWGTLLEPTIVSEFGIRSGRLIARPMRTIVSSVHPFML